MQGEFYTSCIKINGIPLLPPLMTDSIKEEMKYYRFLAVKVEEKLKAKQFVKHNIRNKCTRTNIMEPVNKLKDIECNSDSDASNHNIMNDTNNSDSSSKTTIVEHVPIVNITEEIRDEHNIQSSTSSTQYSQFQSYLTNDIVNNSEPITTKIDQSKCINVTKTMIPNKDLISPDGWKPDVPRTLDIIPMTLSNPKYEKDNTTVSKEDGNPPKLSRQGSYVLDTPSPMLLAHIHTEFTDQNYVPTPTAINISQRKQWNITQSKMEWENKQFVAEDTKASNKLECTMHESSFQHTESDVLRKSYQTNESMDCTETMIAKENTYESNIMPTQDNHVSKTDFENRNLSEESNRDDSTSVLNLVNKLQESMENLNSPETQVSCIDGNKHYNNTINTEEYEDLVIKAKSSVTSEKLLIVYKEIEEMHKKQMMELINRQQKEQSLLQAEFKKQQMLLLAEIQKCSSGIPCQADVSNVASNQSVPSNETRLRDTVSETKPQLNINSPSLHREVYCNSELSSASHANVVVCTLDYISSKNLCLPTYCKSRPFIMDTSPVNLNFDFTRKINSCDTIHNYSNNNDNSNSNNNNNYNYDNNNCVVSYDRIIHKNSAINRQSFPLDSNTIHVPVLDTSIYLDKHVWAVNIINAYARGYLVRRLMQTERVITLKKIYKEALQCMLKLHVDAPLNLAEVNFLHRLQLQCDAASMNLVELFGQPSAKRMKVIAQDREIKQSRTERPTSARSYSFATQKTLARKNLKEFESTITKYQRPLIFKKDITRTRCQTWTSDIREKLMSPNTLNQSIRRSTSAGIVRKPWR